MLCRVRTRCAKEDDEDAFPYQLEILARSAVGGAGQVVEDAARFPTASALMEALHDLQIDRPLIVEAESALESNTQGNRWVTVGTDLQISPHLLSAAGFYLHTPDDEG